MKIALFSDIHANLPALEACLKSIDEQQPDAVYCLGDLVGYNVWPNEVINEIRRRRIPTIAGNYDQGIGLMTGECGCAYKTDKDKDLGQRSIAFTDAAVRPDERRYLRTLPAHIRVAFQLNNDKLNLLLVHGSPRKINEYLFEEREEKSLLRIMEEADADILCFGHTHKPYHRVLPTEPQEQPHYRHAVNIGSVGKPKDGDARGCYVLLTINADSAIGNKETVQVEFVRFDYDVEQAAKAIEESPLPAEFADMLRKAY
ncbi:metallophosphoesterase family protein [Paraflavisolibacter sp. H34]|uniref:metallophosphoesterase family protein n=1 Tax=Huijunlia imazamoxiresistens TaxID=3127457 RepID=UPI003018B393